MYWSMTLTLSESSEWHSHDVFELVFCHTGTGILIVDQEDIELVSRRTILVAPKVRHRFLFREDESADLKIVCVTSADVATHLSATQSSFLYSLNNLGYASTDYSEKKSPPWELIEMIPNGLGNQNPSELHIAWGIIGLLCATCMRGNLMLENGPGSKHLKTIRTICEWLDNHLEDAGDLDEISLRFRLSRSLLTREFRRYTSTSIVEYINIRRLQMAGAILSSTEKDVAEVAFESGFSSLSNFYRRFKRMYGVTPVEFRSQFFKN